MTAPLTRSESRAQDGSPIALRGNEGEARGLEASKGAPAATAEAVRHQLDGPDDSEVPALIVKRARIRAATDEVTLQALLIKALDAELTRREKAEARREARRLERRVGASR